LVIIKKNNRKIPYKKLINQLFYKGESESIKIEETNESYTSKVDALSMEKICKHKKYKGCRVRRGLFKSNTTMNKIKKISKKDNNKILINADINGALNIMRKNCNKHKEYLNMRKIIRKNIKNILNPIKFKWTRKGWLNKPSILGKG